MSEIYWEINRYKQLVEEIEDVDDSHYATKIMI